MRLIKDILSLVKYKPNEEPRRISASQAGNDNLQIYLANKYAGMEDTEISQATIGSLLHLGIENLEKLSTDDILYYTEVPIGRQIPNTDIYATATLDLVEYDNDIKANIYDWKTTKLYTGKKVKDDIAKGRLFENQYILQLNIQKYVLEKGTPVKKLYLAMFYKDAGVNYKTGEVTKDFELIEVPAIPEEELVIYLQNKATEAWKYIDNDEVPDKCKDLWPRKIKGRAIPSRCRFYCNYKSVCPHYTETVDEQTEKW